MGSLRNLLRPESIRDVRFGNQVGDRVDDMGSDDGDILVWKQSYKGKPVVVHLRSTDLHFGMVWVDIIDISKIQKRHSMSLDLLETWLLEKLRFSNPEHTQFEELEELKKWAKKGGLRFVGIGVKNSGWERYE